MNMINKEKIADSIIFFMDDNIPTSTIYLYQKINRYKLGLINATLVKLHKDGYITREHKKRPNMCFWKLTIKGKERYNNIKSRRELMKRHKVRIRNMNKIYKINIKLRYKRKYEHENMYIIVNR